MKEKTVDSLSFEIREKVESQLDSNTFALVDVEYKNKAVTIYIYKKNGKIDLEELATLNRNIHPILENISRLKDGFSLEISSPGIYRKIKSRNEFNIFIDRNVKILTDEDKIVNGKIIGLLDEENLKILIDKEIFTITINNIKKAALNG
jgi:ribosome maturation factor RimP